MQERVLTMNRTLITLVLLLACPMVGLAATRIEIPLDHGWIFHFGDPGKTATWKSVEIPHTWNSKDCTSPDIRRGRGWYRLAFATPALESGDRVYLCFDGVSRLATVWLNGHLLGTHDNAFSRFRLDATDAINRKGSNVLTVLADSTWHDALPPREGDFAFCGGIYRKVELLVTHAVAIDPLDLGGPGVWLTTPVVGVDKASLDASVDLRNTTLDEQPVEVDLDLYDAAGLDVGHAAVRRLAPAGRSEAHLKLELLKPRLWQGRVDPYLYTARITLKLGGTAIDEVSQDVGFRTFALDPDRGFLLNGRPYDLHGVALHQDREGKGWAISDADRAQDFKLIADMGATFVRLVHYQHDSEEYRLADRLGLIVWAENALVNTVSTDPKFTQRCVRQVEELIRQGRNHPCIAFWSVGNEVQTDKPGALPLLQALARVAKLEDPSRFTTLASTMGEPPSRYGIDVIGYNQYFGWYHGAASDFGPWLDAQHKAFPGQCVGMSEYGAGAGTGIHSADPKRMDHSEEYQCLFHETYWNILKARPWVCFKTVWQMFDAASPGRNEGERPGINDKGLVTRDRKTPKDAYYFYQSQWSDKLMVHLDGRRFSPRPAGAWEIKAYTNAANVELVLDGKPLGATPIVGGIARWPHVELGAGVHRLEAIAQRQGATVRDVCTLVAAPEKAP